MVDNSKKTRFCQPAQVTNKVTNRNGYMQQFAHPRRLKRAQKQGFRPRNERDTADFMKFIEMSCILLISASF